MSLNGKKISEFKLQAYHNEDFIEVTDKDLLGKWSVLFFSPADICMPDRTGRPGKQIC